MYLNTNRDEIPNINYTPFIRAEKVKVYDTMSLSAKRHELNIDKNAMYKQTSVYDLEKSENKVELIKFYGALAPYLVVNRYKLFLYEQIMPYNKGYDDVTVFTDIINYAASRFVDINMRNYTSSYDFVSKLIPFVDDFINIMSSPPKWYDLQNFINNTKYYYVINNYNNKDVYVYKNEKYRPEYAVFFKYKYNILYT